MVLWYPRQLCPVIWLRNIGGSWNNQRSLLSQQLFATSYWNR